jgi:hypothetical protein
MEPKMKGNGSGQVDKKVGNGTTIREAFGQDHSDVHVKNTRGKDMGGSVTDLSHSLTGTSAKQDHD